MGRSGQPREIAYAVLYLAYGESSFVTGSELVIDGAGRPSSVNLLYALARVYDAPPATRHPVDAPAARAMAAELSATERAVKPGTAAPERAVIGVPRVKGQKTGRR